MVRIFPNREACLRLVSALCVEQSEEWLSGRRYLDMSLLEASDDEDAEPTATRNEQEVASMAP